MLQNLSIKTVKILLGMVLGLLLAFSASGFIYAQTQNELDALDAFVDIVGDEIDLYDDFIYYIDNIAPNYGPGDVDLFLNEINSYRNQFNSILNRLERASTGHFIYQQSIQGTKEIISGLDDVYYGIQVGDESAAIDGLTTINNAADPINAAIAEHDSLVDAYNSSIESSGYYDDFDYDSPEFESIFNFKIFFILLGVGGGLYVALRSWGDSINKAFEASIKKFLSSGDREVLVNKEALNKFGTVAIIFLPFLIYLFVFSIYAVLLFIYWGFGIVFVIFPLGAIIGFGGLLIGTGIGIVISIAHLVNPPQRKTLGIEIKREDHKHLWDFTDNTAKKLNANPIDKIIITPNPGIGVYLEGNLLQAISGKGKRVLEIGLPSTHNLKVNEFEAIVAHEYGHFSNKDTQWGAFINAMGQSLVSALRSVPGPPKENEDRGFIVGLIFALNPAYWSLLIFTTLFFMITKGFSRAKEVRADLTSMEMFGGEAFRNGLLKVSTNDTIFSEVVQEEMFDFLKEGKVINNFSVWMDYIYKSVSKKKMEDFQKAILQRAAGNLYDSHPRLQTRLEYAEKFGASTKTGSRKSVDTLFDDWEDINKKAAKLYNERLVAVAQLLATNQEGGQESENKKDN